MDRAKPSTIDVMNVARGLNNTGPQSIEHAHHLPRIPEQGSAPVEEMIDKVEPDTPPDLDLDIEPTRTPRIRLMFRSVMRGIRGEANGPAET